MSKTTSVHDEMREASASLRLAKKAAKAAEAAHERSGVALTSACEAESVSTKRYQAARRALEEAYPDASRA